MLDSKELRTLQLLELDILKEVIKICRNNNINYFIIGGTLLGAVRHGGFIPWDDDIDIAMPRDDYEKFINVAKKQLPENLTIQHYTVDDNYLFYLLKVINKNVFVSEIRGGECKSNLWIDILPIDGVPNNKAIYILYKYYILALRALLGFANIDHIRILENRPIVERILIALGTYLPIGKIIDRNNVRRKIDKMLCKMKISQCNSIGTYLGAYGFREVVPQKFFGKGSTIEFENMKVNAPEKVDLYLKSIYGNYMKLPPLDKRKGHIDSVFIEK